MVHAETIVKLAMLFKQSFAFKMTNVQNLKGAEFVHQLVSVMNAFLILMANQNVNTRKFYQRTSLFTG